MINFVKILKYDLEPKGVNVYEYITGVLSQQIDPPTLFPGKLAIDSDIVLFSTLKRSTGCIKKDVEVEYIPVAELREIPFSAGLFFTEKEWVRDKSVVVRRAFKKAFIEDHLLIPREKIFSEILELFKMIKGFEDKSVAAISHSFKLKVIQAYLATKGEVFMDPKLIHQFIKDNEKTFDFGKGFSADIKIF